MSGAPIKPTEVLCRDGSRFLVTGNPGHVVVFATFRDKAVVESGLGLFQTFHEPGDLRAEHRGMTVEVVRAYVKAHGGVAQAGEEALALLKALPSQAAPAEATTAAVVPATDSQPPAVEQADPENPFSGVARRPKAEVAPQSLGTAPGMKLDELTDAVIEARRAVTQLTGPLVWHWGKLGSDRDPEVETLWRRITSGSGLGARLGVARDAQYASHPLREEALALRTKLFAISDEALAERNARERVEMARFQKLNGVHAVA